MSDVGQRCDRCNSVVLHLDMLPLAGSPGEVQSSRCESLSLIRMTPQHTEVPAGRVRRRRFRARQDALSSA
jgi:hypothetical protein